MGKSNGSCWISSSLRDMSELTRAKISAPKCSNNLAEKKASLLWSTESFDKVAWKHFPHQGEASDYKDASECKLSSVKLESHVQDKDCKVTLLSSPRSVNGSYGGMQYFSNKDGREAKAEAEIDGDCDKKEHDMHFPLPIGCQLNVFKPETNFINEQDLNTDAHNLPAHQTFFKRSEEFTRMYNHDSTFLNVVPSYQDAVLAKDTATAIVNSQLISRSTEGGSNMDITRAYIEKKEMKLPHRNWLGLLAYTDNSYANQSKNRKCKEPIMCNADDNGSTSNRRKDGHDHSDYVRSEEMRLTLKRTRSNESEQEKFTIGKRLKRHGSGSWSTSLTRQGESSFMNWVAAITNGLIGPTQVMPLKWVQQPGQRVTRGSVLREDKVDVRFSHESKGFKSIFQAMYYHGSNAGSSKGNYIGKKAELVALNGPLKVDKRNDVSCCVHEERLEFDSHSCVAAARLTFGNLNKEDICNETVNFGNVGLAPQDDCTNSYDNVLAIQKSLWVARLSRKLTSPELEPMQCSNYADLAVQKSLDGADHNLHCEKVHTTIENKQAQYNSERIETDEHEGSKQVPSTFTKRLGSLEHCKTLGFADDAFPD
ncbi:hypothetical protein HPP92_017865 [Vanilla planifolia]|uniref:Uncharacterized protein n=1 Tax=Vanilla planifolia TaxID=51239 RepID=A0A835QIU9_VANPL|nr:hypothetical protein HPP92_017865 [Vanilla planifolia]